MLTAMVMIVWHREPLRKSDVIRPV